MRPTLLLFDSAETANCNTRGEMRTRARACGIEASRIRIDAEYEIMHATHAHHVARRCLLNTQRLQRILGARGGGEAGKNSEGGRSRINDVNGGTKFDPSGTPPGDAPMMSTIRVTEDDPRKYECSRVERLVLLI